MLNLALVLEDRGDRAGAIQLDFDALALDRKVHGSRDEHVALTLNNLGMVLFRNQPLERGHRSPARGVGDRTPRQRRRRAPDGDVLHHLANMLQEQARRIDTDGARGIADVPRKSRLGQREYWHSLVRDGAHRERRGPQE
jgi:hypothetical protein